jgi:4-hydroxy-tetrahydrodipicolinate synthase
MKLPVLQGVIIALPSPLTTDEDVDTDSLFSLLDHCLAEGADGIMLLGTMGEGAALVDAQKKVLIEAAVAHIKKRIPILATVSPFSTRKALEDIKNMQNMGVDYLVCTSPSYYKFPDPKSIILHVHHLAEASQIPVFFYNAPIFTGNHVSIDTLENILRIENIAGVKDSSCNFQQFMELLRRYPDKTDRPGLIMQGDESVFDSSLLLGADGIISGGGVVYIKLLRKLFKACIEGRKLEAMAFQREFSGQLSRLLLPVPQRDWLINIKRKLVEMEIISDAYVSAPFMSGKSEL